MNFCGPYQHYGGMSVLLLVDTYSRYVIARPVRSTDIDSFKGVLVDVMDTFGKARVWHTDNGPRLIVMATVNSLDRWEQKSHF